MYVIYVENLMLKKIQCKVFSVMEACDQKNRQATNTAIFSCNKFDSTIQKFLFKKFSESNTSVASSQFEASPDTVSTQQFLSSFFQPNYANVRLPVFLSLVLVEKFLQRQLLFYFSCQTFVLVFI